MTQDEIIEMAREAGSIDSENVILTVYNAFSSAEREEFAVHAVDIARRAIAKEREACAKLCDEYQDIPATEPRHCAQDIRARGKA